MVWPTSNKQEETPLFPDLEVSTPFFWVQDSHTKASRLSSGKDRDKSGGEAQKELLHVLFLKFHQLEVFSTPEHSVQRILGTNQIESIKVYNSSHSKIYYL